MSQAKTTTDHKEIKKWIEARKGRPTVVDGTQSKDGELDPIAWDEFFKTLDDRKLAFLHRDKTADGKASRLFKFVHREG